MERERQMESKQSIYGCTLAQLEAELAARGENPAKASLIFRQLYREEPADFTEWRWLKAPLRRWLAESCRLALPRVERQLAEPGARKYLFRLEDGNRVEGVVINHRYGAALCLSTQVGCAMGCAFCRSGHGGKLRDLTAGEMVGQILAVRQELGALPDRLALMGIGEPFDNYRHLLTFLEIVTAAAGLNYGPRHITVSTCGLAPQLRQYAAQPQPVNLCVSLHAPNDELRSQLMPINRVYDLKTLLAAAQDYSRRSRRRVVFEYTLLAGVNDSEDCGQELAQLLGGRNCSVNLIPYNPAGGAFTPSPRLQVLAFYHLLRQAGIRVTIRKEMGGGLLAACGQLRAGADSSE